MARGRRTGYSNYSERVGADNYPLQLTSWKELSRENLESLRRKFKTLYNKPKPSGNGEVKPAHKAILWAKCIQMEIEEKAGSHTTFDGADEDEDSGNRGNSGSNNGAETNTGASSCLPGSTIYTPPSSNTGAMPDPDGAGVRRDSNNDGDPGSSIAGHARPSFVSPVSQLHGGFSKMSNDCPFTTINDGDQGKTLQRVRTKRTRLRLPRKNKTLFRN
ncbi:hypothetical protein GN244_ATG18667 [Phytophthora infestans]|uniref:DUF6818 domain-containing protein n=1 Tax=Phytophthora infestans TaxID=4787 RepID=A0A833S894_PHYIN|nr:hypothetical protein GN244_ATG18667 [Phytophthora infestans]